MKKAIQLVVIMMAFLPAISFAQKEKTVWKEMKAFHSLMAATFHPAEEGNLVPLKKKADSLFVAVQAWYESPIPASFKPDETKEALRNLYNKCAEISKAVAAKLTDAELKKSIGEAHDLFHKIVGECRKDGE